MQPSLHAQNAPGYTIHDTQYYQRAIKAEEKLTKLPNGMYPHSEYIQIWSSASRDAVTDAVLGGVPVASQNDIVSLRKNSVQYLYELPALRKLGGTKAATSGLAGGLDIVAGLNESNPVNAASLVTSGSLQTAGAAIYAFGVKAVSPVAQKLAGSVFKAAGVAALPKTVNNLLYGTEYESFQASLDVIGLVVAPVGIVGAYFDLVVKPPLVSMFSFSEVELQRMFYPAL